MVAKGDWRVLPHDPIERLEPDLWRVEGALERMPLRRVMTLVRLGDGRLVIHNAMALGDAAMAEIEKWGSPAVLVVPGAYHRLDAAAYVARYSGLEVYCPAGARGRVERVVPVAGGYSDWQDDKVTLTHLDGVLEREGVMTVTSDSGSTTLVFNDLIFNMPHGEGIGGLVLRYLTRSTGGPRISRIARWQLVDDDALLRAHLRRLAAVRQLERIIVSHHRTIVGRAEEALMAVAATI